MPMAASQWDGRIITRDDDDDDYDDAGGSEGVIKLSDATGPVINRLYGTSPNTRTPNSHYKCYYTVQITGTL